METKNEKKITETWLRSYDKKLEFGRSRRSWKSSSSRICLIALRLELFIANYSLRKKKVPFSMAIGNGELMRECFPKHSHMGTARLK